MKTKKNVWDKQKTNSLEHILNLNLIKKLSIHQEENTILKVDATNNRATTHMK